MLDFVKYLLCINCNADLGFLIWHVSRVDVSNPLLILNQPCFSEIMGKYLQ